MRPGQTLQRSALWLLTGLLVACNSGSPAPVTVDPAAVSMTPPEGQPQEQSLTPDQRELQKQCDASRRTFREEAIRKYGLDQLLPLGQRLIAQFTPSELRELRSITPADFSADAPHSQSTGSTLDRMHELYENALIRGGFNPAGQRHPEIGRVLIVRLGTYSLQKGSIPIAVSMPMDESNVKPGDAYEVDLTYSPTQDHYSAAFGTSADNDRAPLSLTGLADAQLSTSCAAIPSALVTQDFDTLD